MSNNIRTDSGDAFHAWEELVVTRQGYANGVVAAMQREGSYSFAQLLSEFREAGPCVRHGSNLSASAGSMSPITRRWQKDLDHAAQSQPIVIGAKVRRIDEPYVVLRVREIDPEGLIDGTPKALCFNYYGHGRWMALTELELV